MIITIVATNIALINNHTDHIYHTDTTSIPYKTLAQT